ncbi:MAG: hypothetical protein J7J76_09535 [Candidatus Latescibacteria bacterium]|nr:hypothetical protein [Candidatus Latescibacterota bacterium]
MKNMAIPLTLIFLFVVYQIQLTNSSEGLEQSEIRGLGSKEKFYLKWMFRKGISYNYEMIVDTESVTSSVLSGHKKIDTSKASSRFFLSITSLGNNVASMTIDLVSLVINGETDRKTSFPKKLYELKMLSDGSVVHEQNIPIAQEHQLLLNMLFSLPEKEVKWSEGWSKKIVIPPRDGKWAMEGNGKFKVLGEVMFEGYKCIKIKSEFAINMENEKGPIKAKGYMTARGVSYFAYKEGKFIKSNMESDMKLTSISEPADFKEDLSMKQNIAISLAN